MLPNEFKTTLFGEAEVGWLTIFTTPNKHTTWLGISEAMPALDLTQNCYLGLGIRQARKTHGRGTLDDIIGIPGLWLDLDYASPGAHKVTHPLPPNEDAALSLLDGAPYPPSLVVHSGHGLQVYWLFNEAWYFESDEDRQAAGALCQSWQRIYQDLGKSRGWHVDSTADLTRVFRLPGSRNHKTPDVREVFVLEQSGVRYEPTDFEPYIY